MNETKEIINNNNSSNDLIINIKVINKIFSYNKENEKKLKKIKSLFKSDKNELNFGINKHKFNIHKNNNYLKQKRVWSSQNLLNKDKNNSFNKNNYISNYYCGSALHRAPSIKENKLEINEILKKENNKRLNELNNMYNTMMINESKLYRQKLYLFSNDSKRYDNDNKMRNNLKKKYSTNDMNNINNIIKSLKPNLKKIIYKKKKKQYCKIHNDISQKEINNNLLNKSDDLTISTNKSSYYSRYKDKKKYYKIKNINDIYLSKRNIGKTYKKLNLIKKEEYLKKNENILYFSENKEKNNESLFQKYKDIEISRMRLDLNDIVLAKTNEKQHFNELEEKIIKFNALKEFQKNRLEVMSRQDINGLENRILLLEEIIKKYNKITINYFRELKDYIHFLNDEKYRISNYFEEENNLRFNLFYDIEKLMTDNVLKQRELEHLVEIRHFLIQVKNTLIKQPSYFNDLLKEISRKYELGKLIINLKIQPQNQNVTRFLESIPELKDMEVSSPLFLQYQNKTLNENKKDKKYSQIFRIRKSNNNFKKYINYPDKQIFESPEEFLIVFDNIESKILRLMKENDDIKRNIEILKNEYEEVFENNLILERGDDIFKKKEKLKLVMDENNKLNKKYNYLKNIKEDKKSIKDEIKKERGYIIMDLNAFKKIMYHKMINQFKYRGLLILAKLVDIIKNFFSLNYSNYGINKAYKFVEKSILNKILRINIKNINNINQSYINIYILNLLKVYEDICEYIKYKDKQYNSIESNKLIIHMKNEELQLQRKINNSRNIRQLAEEKRINGIKKIIEKNKRPNLLFKGNIDDDVVLRNKANKKSNSAKLGNIKKDFKEREFNFYISYNYYDDI